jgi:hypothetical protein
MCQQCGNNTCGGCQPIIPSGLNGVDGINAFNFTTASFTMPAVNSNVTVNVKATNPFKNSWFAVGQVVFIETAGYFQVVSITGSNQVTLKNLGYSDANFTPAAPATTIASNVKVSPAGLQGAAGSSGGAGANGTTRVAYSLDDILSGSGGVVSSKTFITQTILAADMPQTEGSSLVLTFNVRTENADFTEFRNVGVTFGGQVCILGTGSPANRVPISGAQFFESQVKVEVIRGSNATVGYARASLCEIDFGSGPICYNESNPLSGLNFGITNDFVIFGRQNQDDTFTFSLLTVDKITAPTP